MLTIYCGFDPREEVGYHTFCSSVIARASVPVAFVPLHKNMIRQAIGDQEDGTNAFTVSRFLVPYLHGYSGVAVFMDAADMIVHGDVAELLDFVDWGKAVQVVQRDEYKTRHPVKYVGTRMESPNVDYHRKQWASVMLFNCGHMAWRKVTPAFVRTSMKLDLLQLRFLDDKFIGELPNEWNRCVDEGDHLARAKCLHWTAGTPGFPEYHDAPGSDLWRVEHKRMNHATP